MLSGLQNDHQALMKQVEEGLHQLHAREKEKRDRDEAEARAEAQGQALPQPFAQVNAVSPGSPASFAASTGSIALEPSGWPLPLFPLFLYSELLHPAFRSGVRLFSAASFYQRNPSLTRWAGLKKSSWLNSARDKGIVSASFRRVYKRATRSPSLARLTARISNRCRTSQPWFSTVRM